jgi:hypothetical protein
LLEQIRQSSIQKAELGRQFTANAVHGVDLVMDDLDDMCLKHRGGDITALPSMISIGWAKRMGVSTVGAFNAMEGTKVTTCGF